MRYFITSLIIAITSAPLSAQNLPVVLQVKYSPWGGISADKDDFGSDEDFNHYEMTFDHSYSGRIIVGPFYISHQRSKANLENTSDVNVKTIAIGLAGINYDAIESEYNTYLMGGLGIGQGTFIFNTRDEEKEYFFEANAEIGLKPTKHLLMGAGIDFQHFGEFRESKASSWTFYISSGLTF